MNKKQIDIDFQVSVIEFQPIGPRFPAESIVCTTDDSVYRMDTDKVSGFISSQGLEIISETQRLRLLHKPAINFDQLMQELSESERKEQDRAKLIARLQSRYWQRATELSRDWFRRYTAHSPGNARDLLRALNRLIGKRTVIGDVLELCRLAADDDEKAEPSCLEPKLQELLENESI